MISCNDNYTTSPNTDTDVATAFIRALLDNKLKDAEQFILKEDTNKQYFEVIKRKYKKKSKEELEKYKAADIIINEISNVTDTISIINYSNSYNKQAKNKVKVVRINNKWQIDLKYTFSGNM